MVEEAGLAEVKTGDGSYRRLAGRQAGWQAGWKAGCTEEIPAGTRTDSVAAWRLRGKMA